MPNGYPQVLSIARDCGAYVVRGNHDDAGLRSYHLLHSVGTQPPSSRAWVTGMGAQDMEMLEELPFSLVLPEWGVAVVHAGLVPGVGMGEQAMLDMYKMRDVLPLGDGR